MSGFELKPVSDAGSTFVELAERHAENFWERAARYDREGQFPLENIEDLKRSGAIAAAVPKEFGGMGVESVLDWGLGIGRMARGDGSTAIALNMHLTGSFLLMRAARRLRASGSQGDAVEAGRIEEILRDFGTKKLVSCGPASESGTDLLHPLVEIRRVEGGWKINGRKIFGTLSPASDLVVITTRTAGDGEESLFLGAFVPVGTLGMSFLDDWDALGMRASGSQSVAFEDCVIPEEKVLEFGPWGEWNPEWFAIFLPGNFGLLAAFLGIAERAQELIRETLTTRRKAPGNRLIAERSALQRGFAESEVDLAVSRGIVERTGRAIDALYARYPDDHPPLDELHAHFSELQCTKLAVTDRAIAVVDRAITLSGGAGYFSRNPLSRLYRDVRAGPLMQPLSPNEAYGYIGKVALGLDPKLEE